MAVSAASMETSPLRSLAAEPIAISSFRRSVLPAIPGYMRVDVAASYVLSAHASVIGHVTNLFNKDYQDVLGFPALGRAAYIGMRFRLGGE